MQRVRMALPYFNEFEWDAEVVCVNPDYTDIIRDELLIESIPPGVKVHRVKALPKKLTSRFGLGSIALRSLWYYWREVNRLLAQKKFDLIYFSTTQFPVCILGAYWKKRFGVPYVIDMQDPWHSDYYRDKPKDEQPSKYWFSYRLNKYLEPIAIKNADGLISVSQAYVSTLKNRYPFISNIPSSVITFGAFEADFKIANAHKSEFKPVLTNGFTNIVYIGRGGADMHKAIAPLFGALKNMLAEVPETAKKLKFYFIGTSYAAAGKGKPTILPLAQHFGVEGLVVELTDRISYYHTLNTLQQASALFIPGSDDAAYTASKIYPYLLTGKPLLAIFNKASPAVQVLQEYGAADVYDYDNVPGGAISSFLEDVVSGNPAPVEYNPAAIKKYSAREVAFKQCLLFNAVLHGKN
jgi:hypothetical protein